MKIRDIRAFTGRNIYSFQPVIRMQVDLEELCGRETADYPGFNDRLLGLLPSLAGHGCSYGEPGGFVRRLREGTFFSHVLEHMAIELQCLAGTAVAFGKTRRQVEAGVYDIVFGCRAKEGGLAAGRYAVEIVSKLLRGEAVSIEPIIREIRTIIDRTELGPSTAALVQAAKARQIPVLRIGAGSLVQLGYGANQKRIQATTTANTGCIAADIACDKILTKEVLELAGVPVPAGGAVATPEEAAAVAAALGYPVVVKPHNGNQGKGVTLNLRSAREVKAAFRLATHYSDQVIIEKYIDGKHYRIIVVNGKVEAAAERLPAFITGDGQSTIRQLVERENSNPQRGEGHARPLTRIAVDAVVLMHLARQGLNVDTIPAAGQQVFLRENANLSTGGIAIDVTDRLHPDNAALALRVAAAIGLDIAGIDLVAEDIARPVLGGHGAVIEVNAAPGIRMHHYPSAGQPREVAAAIIDGLFPPPARARIPLVAITGTNGKTTTTRMIAAILQAQGLRVGMTTTDGVYIDGVLVRKGDTTGPASARLVLTDPSVEAAVLETARGGIIRQGLAYDWSDVGIITNITNDHLGLDGVETLDDLADAKALVVETVRRDGYAVLNADDPYCTDLARRVRSHIIYFSLEESSLVIRRHLSQGGTGVFVRDGLIVLAQGETQESGVLHTREIPATHGGIAAHNVQNALAAVAAATGLGIELDTIRTALSGFTSSVAVNPGRMNIFDILDFRVIIDYGHNHDGYAKVLRTIAQMGAARRVGVITIPGDRDDDYLRTSGAIAAKGFDHIIIKEDGDRRGREPGEIARLMLEGVLSGGMPPSEVEVILPEKDALRHAMEHSQPGDVIVVFYEVFSDVLSVVQEVGAALTAQDYRKKETNFTLNIS